MNMRAMFSDGLQPLEPTKPTTPLTAGSCVTMAASSFCRSAMAAKEMSCARLGLAEDEAGVLLGKQALGNRHVKPAGQDDQRDGRQQGERLVAQHPAQAAVVDAQLRVEGILAHLVQPAAFRASRRRCRKRAHITGVRVSETKADMTTATVTVTANSRNSTPDHAAHKQQRDEHGDQREGDRDDGEADLAGALQRRLERLLALLDVAHDVLDHDDGIVDHEADGDGEGHQREVVDAVAAADTSRAKVPTSASGTAIEGMTVAQKCRRKMKITMTTRPTVRIRVNLHVGDRRSDRQRAVGHQVDMHRLRHRGQEPGHHAP